MLNFCECRCVESDSLWLADSDNLPPPDVIAQEIVDDLEAALEQFRLIAGAQVGISDANLRASDQTGSWY